MLVAFYLAFSKRLMVVKIPTLEIRIWTFGQGPPNTEQVFNCSNSKIVENWRIGRTVCFERTVRKFSEEFSGPKLLQMRYQTKNHTLVYIFDLAFTVVVTSHKVLTEIQLGNYSLRPSANPMNFFTSIYVLCHLTIAIIRITLEGKIL